MKPARVLLVCGFCTTNHHYLCATRHGLLCACGTCSPPDGDAPALVSVGPRVPGAGPNAGAGYASSDWLNQ